jgi:hypothetical protein
MAELNLGLRFLLELLAMAAAAYWGYQVGGHGLPGIALAVAAVAVFVVGWAMFIAPRADSPIPADVRPFVGSAVLLVAAGGLAVAGQPVLGAALAVAIVVNTILMLLLGGPSTVG